MTGERTLPWILFPLSEKRHRGFSFQATVENGFEPSDYRSLLHDESPMTAEALLDFKVWGKSPNLTCFFRNIRTGEKFRLSASITSATGATRRGTGTLISANPALKTACISLKRSRAKRGYARGSPPSCCWRRTEGTRLWRGLRKCLSAKAGKNAEVKACKANRRRQPYPHNMLILQTERGGAVFASGTLWENAALQKFAPPWRVSFSCRSAIPSLDHIKTIVTEFFHALFFFLTPSGILDGDLGIFRYFSDGNSDFVCFGRIIFPCVELAFRYISSWVSGIKRLTVTP